MYRIHFKHFGGFFCIQVVVFGLMWVSVRKDGKIVQHETFDSASKAVIDLGLNKLYENKSADMYRQQVSTPHPAYDTFSR